MSEIILPEKIITVRFKKLSSRPEFLVKNHPLEGGKLNNSIDRIPLPLDASGDKIEVLTEEERNYIAEKTGRQPDFYSVHNPNGYFRVQGYKDLVVELTKEDKILDLSKVGYYIDYKILLSNPQLVAANASKSNTYDTIKWYMIEGTEVKNENILSKQRRAAFKLYDKYEAQRYILKFLLNSIGAKTSRNIPVDKLQAMVESKIEAQPDIMLHFLEDKYIAYKALLTEAIEKGIIQSQGSNIISNETVGKLSFENTAQTFDNAAYFLAEPSSSETLAKLQAMISQEDKKGK